MVFNVFFFLPSCLIKEKEVFMSLTDYSWEPSVGIA